MELLLVTLESGPQGVIHEAHLEKIPEEGDVVKLSESNPFRFKVQGVEPKTPTVFFNGKYLVTKTGEEREHPESKAFMCSDHSGSYPHIEVRRIEGLDRMNEGEGIYCIMDASQEAA